MSNSRHATGLDEVAAAAAQQPQQQPGQGTIFQSLQGIGLPATVRPSHTPKALAVEVVPNPNLASDAKKIIMVTMIRQTGVEFLGFEPDEWDSFAAMVQSVMAEARSQLEVAQPGQIPNLLRPSGPVPH